MRAASEKGWVARWHALLHNRCGETVQNLFEGGAAVVLVGTVGVAHPGFTVVGVRGPSESAEGLRESNLAACVAVFLG